MSTGKKTPGKAGTGGKAGNGGKPLRFGGRFDNGPINDISDSESDSDTGVYERSGGVKLNVSPYRPPHVRAAKSLGAGSNGAMSKATSGTRTVVKNGNDMMTPDESSTDIEGPLAVKMANMTFQRGSPDGTDVFGSATLGSTSSSDKDIATYFDVKKTDVRPAGGITFDENGNVRGNMISESMSQDPIGAASAGALDAGQNQLQAQDDAIAQENATAQEQRMTQERDFRDFAALAMRRQRPRRHLIGGQDAQSVYSPTCCVFIANLPSNKLDEALEAEITRHFSAFGTVFVKIKRDERDMPFGFLQYTNEGDAADAISNGVGTIIFGRACRVELAKANRTYLVFHYDRSPITMGEVMEIVAPYGDLAHIQPLRPDFAEILNLPNAVYVEFTEFDCDRDIVNHYRGDRRYRVTTFDITKVFHNPPSINPDREYLRQYEAARKSVFVGNLPAEITEDSLREAFEASGDVINVHVVRRPHKELGSFAFIEFARPDMPEIAIRQLHGKEACNTILHVEKKNHRHGAPRRVNSSFVRQLHGTPGHAGNGSGNRGRHTPRRVVTAAPGNTPYHHAQHDMTPAQGFNHQHTFGEQTPAENIEHNGQPNPAIVVTPTAPMVVSSSMGAQSNNGNGFMTPGQHLAPPFGPNGYYLPSPGPMAPFPGYPGAYGGFNGHHFPVYGNPHQQGFFGGQMSYYQDPASGLIYPMPPLNAPPVVDQTPAFAQRSVSAMPYVSAAEHLQRVSNNSLKSKKSVSFADPVIQDPTGHTEDFDEKDCEEASGEKNGAD